MTCTICGGDVRMLCSRCREKLAVYKAPERVEFVSELPKTATGKILKRILRDQAPKAGA